MITGFGNNVVSALAENITAEQTSFSVMTGEGALFETLLTTDQTNTSNPLNVYGKITLTNSGQTVYEICHVTAVDGDRLTVLRGQEGTTAKGWALNSVVANFATRGSENTFVQIEHLQTGHYTTAIAGGTANGLTIQLPSTFFVNGSTDWELRTPLIVIPSLTNTGASTLMLTLSGKVIGTFPLYKGNKAALEAGDLVKDVPFACLLDRSKTFFNVLNPVKVYSLGDGLVRTVNSRAPDTKGAVSVTAQDIFNGQAVAIGNAVDLNTLTTPGLYFQAANAQAESGKNYPEANAGSLEVYKHAGITQVYRVYSNSRQYARTLYSGTWSAWGKVYDTNNKPSAGDVAAIPLAGSTGVTGIVRSSAELQSASANSFRIGYGGYGAFWRNDGANLYLMLTNKNDPWGGYNDLRPFRVSVDTGDITINKLGLIDYTNFDARYYTQTAANGKFQPKGSYYTETESDARYQKINTASKAANGWFKDTNTGMIFQWGKNASTGVGNSTITFPVAFPNACLNVQNTIVRNSGSPGEDTWGFITSFNKTSASVTGDQMGSYWFAMGY